MTLQDNELADKKFQKELNSGTAALVLLAVLAQTEEPMYGYQIAKHLDTGSDEVPVKQGALYPVLRSLEAGGLLESRVEPSVSGPPRRYYQITPSGRDTLRQWIEIWSRTQAFVESTLKGIRHDD
jgi:PadR family transcriptional regulator PadR